jgi:hypothetical protein
VYEVYSLCIVCWRTHFAALIWDELLKAVLAMIENQRNGEVVDTACLKTVISSYGENYL